MFFYFCVFVICSCWFHFGSLRKLSHTRKMISILSCFNPMYLRQLLWPQDLSTAFRICKNNISHVDVKTFLAKDFGRIYQLTPGLPCVLKNAMEHWSAMKLWTLSSFSAESWHVVLVTFDISWQKKVRHPVRCIKDILSIPSLFEFETFLAKSSCIQPYVSRSRFLQKTVEIQNWLHHNPIWAVGLQQ